MVPVRKVPTGDDSGGVSHVAHINIKTSDTPHLIFRHPENTYCEVKVCHPDTDKSSTLFQFKERK